MANSIQVEVTRHDLVPADTAVTIANAFAEWLDSRGFQITCVTDQRDFEELAKAFVEGWGPR
jgi:hypothetical protein